MGLQYPLGTPCHEKVEWGRAYLVISHKSLEMGLEREKGRQDTRSGSSLGLGF